jgi:hypothetical protein
MESALTKLASINTARFPVAASRHLLAYVRLILLSFMLLFFSANLSSDELERPVVFIQSGDSPVYDKVATTTEKLVLEGCRNHQADCSDLFFVQKNIDNILIDDYKDAFLTVSLGSIATDWLEILPFDGNQLYAMLPYQSRKNRLSPESESLAEIYIDQPYRRYFDLIRTVIPRSSRVGLLIHTNDVEIINILAENASRFNLTIKPSVINDEGNIGEALGYILNDIDVLLALPDSRIHNSRTISHILTTAYRKNIPVVGFSSAYVKAGALAAIYTSPEDIAHQLSEVVVEFVSTGYVEKRFQHATYFSVSINFEVARSLGLPLISPSEVKQTLSKELLE